MRIEMKERIKQLLTPAKILVCAATLFSANLIATSAHAAVMFSWNDGQPANQFFNGSLGNDFTVNVPILVTGVGTFDDNSNGIVSPIDAAIFTLDIGTNTGAIVPGTQVQVTNTSTLLPNSSTRIQTLGTPVLLQPGTYTSVSWNHSGTDGNLNSNAGGFPFTADTGGNLITINNAKRYGLTPGSFPNVPNGDFLFGGGTFEFQIDPNFTPPLFNGVANGSFEFTQHPDHTPANGSPFSNVMLGWEIIGGPTAAGEFNPASIHFDGADDEEPDLDTTIPDGKNVAFINPLDGGFRQTLDMVLDENVEIDISASFGSRIDIPTEKFYELRVLAGGNLLGSASGSVSTGWVQETVHVNVDGNHPDLGQPIVIEILNKGGGQTSVDAVSAITSIPEPASLGLLALMGSVLIRRKRS